MALIKKFKSGDKTEEPKKVLTRQNIGDYDADELAKSLTDSLQSEADKYKGSDRQAFLKYGSQLIQAIKDGNVTINTDGSISINGNYGLNNDYTDKEIQYMKDNGKVGRGASAYQGEYQKSHGIFTTNGTEKFRNENHLIGLTGRWLMNNLSDAKPIVEKPTQEAPKYTFDTAFADKHLNGIVANKAAWFKNNTEATKKIQDIIDALNSADKEKWGMSDKDFSTLLNALEASKESKDYTAVKNAALNLGFDLSSYLPGVSRDQIIPATKTYEQQLDYLVKAWESTKATELYPEWGAYSDDTKQGLRNKYRQSLIDADKKKALELENENRIQQFINNNQAQEEVDYGDLSQYIRYQTPQTPEEYADYIQRGYVSPWEDANNEVEGIRVGPQQVSSVPMQILYPQSNEVRSTDLNPRLIAKLIELYNYGDSDFNKDYYYPITEGEYKDWIAIPGSIDDNGQILVFKDNKAKRINITALKEGYKDLYEHFINTNVKSHKQGGSIQFLADGNALVASSFMDKRVTSNTEARKQQEAKQKQEVKQKQQQKIEAGFDPNLNYMHTEEGGFDMDARDWGRLATVAGDFVSMGGGWFSLAGLASDIGNAYLDFTEPGKESGEAWANLGTNLGMTALSLVPTLGSVKAVKGIKGLSTATKIIPKFLKAAAAAGIISNAAMGTYTQAFNRVASGNYTSQDLQEIARLFQASTGLINGMRSGDHAVNMGQRKRSDKLMKQGLQEGALQIKDKNGKMHTITEEQLAIIKNAGDSYEAQNNAFKTLGDEFANLDLPVGSTSTNFKLKTKDGESHITKTPKTASIETTNSGKLGSARRTYIDDDGIERSWSTDIGSRFMVDNELNINLGPAWSKFRNKHLPDFSFSRVEGFNRLPQGAIKNADGSVTWHGSRYTEKEGGGYIRESKTARKKRTSQASADRRKANEDWYNEAKNAQAERIRGQQEQVKQRQAAAEAEQKVRNEARAAQKTKDAEELAKVEAYYKKLAIQNRWDRGRKAVQQRKARQEKNAQIKEFINNTLAQAKYKLASTKQSLDQYIETAQTNRRMKRNLRDVAEQERRDAYNAPAAVAARQSAAARQTAIQNSLARQMFGGPYYASLSEPLQIKGIEVPSLPKAKPETTTKKTGHIPKKTKNKRHSANKASEGMKFAQAAISNINKSEDLETLWLKAGGQILYAKKGYKIENDVFENKPANGDYTEIEIPEWLTAANGKYDVSNLKADEVGNYSGELNDGYSYVANGQQWQSYDSAKRHGDVTIAKTFNRNNWDIDTNWLNTDAFEKNSTGNNGHTHNYSVNDAGKSAAQLEAGIYKGTDIIGYDQKNFDDWNEVLTRYSKQGELIPNEEQALLNYMIYQNQQNFKSAGNKNLYFDKEGAITDTSSLTLNDLRPGAVHDLITNKRTDAAKRDSNGNVIKDSEGNPTVIKATAAGTAHQSMRRQQYKTATNNYIVQEDGTLKLAGEDFDQSKYETAFASDNSLTEDTDYTNNYWKAIKSETEEDSDSPKDKINVAGYTPQVNLNNTRQLGNVLEGLRTAYLNYNNRIAAKEAMDWDPALKDQLHRIELLEGNYQALREAQNGRERLNSQASKTFTSDAALQLAGQLTATAQGNTIQMDAAKADADRFYNSRHKVIDLANQDLAYNTQVGDYNRGILSQYGKEKAGIKANLRIENAKNWGNFLAGISKQMFDAGDRENQLALQHVQTVAGNANQAAYLKYLKDNDIDAYYKALQENAIDANKKSAGIIGFRPFSYTTVVKKGGRLTPTHHYILQGSKDFNKRKLEEAREFRKNMRKKK